MTRQFGSRPWRGFTLIELMITLALVSLVSMAALPLYQVVSTRMKETELRGALRTIRSALDAYKAAADSGGITIQAGESGFPPSLAILAQGVEVGDKTAVTLTGKPVTQRVMFLRRVPRDPFFSEPGVPPEQTWNTRAYGSPPDAPESGTDVFDVSSKSTRTGLNGVPYAQW